MVRLSESHDHDTQCRAPIMLVLHSLHAGPAMDESETIRLDQFLKLQGLVDTGGHAKMVIQSGEVRVNGEVETRRRRQLRIGDVVEYAGERMPVESDEEAS